MKPNAEPDPFDDNNEEDVEAETTDPAETADPFATDPTDSELASTDMNESQSETSGQESTQSDSTREMPYVLTRDTVKDGRKEIQFYLREDYRNLDERVQRSVEEELDLDLPITDVREAMVRVAAEHSNEVAEILRKDGYKFKE